MRSTHTDYYVTCEHTYTHMCDHNNYLYTTSMNLFVIARTIVRIHMCLPRRDLRIYVYIYSAPLEIPQYAL
jgi:hypothetical protein